MPTCEQRARPKQRVVLYMDDDLIEKVRIEAVKTRVRPRDIVQSRLLESYQSRPAAQSA